MTTSNILTAEAMHQPLFTTAFLYSLWSKDYEAFRETAEAGHLLETLRAWAAKDWQKETAAEGTFVDVFFKRAWGYRASGQSDAAHGYSLQQQYPVPNAGQRGGTGEADIALGHFGLAHVEPIPQVLGEFKDDRSGLDEEQNRSHRRSPVDQCFDYLREARSGRISKVLPTWALVTDMNEFRLYIYGNKAQYQRFIITPIAGDPAVALTEDSEEASFQRFLFWRIFNPNLLLAESGKSPLERLLDEQLTHEKTLEADFYKEYHTYREHLFNCLRDANPDFAENERLRRLVGLTQRLLDRFIFVLYCEDMGQDLGFPRNILRDILIEVAESRFYNESGSHAWDQVRALFAVMRTGGQFGTHRIHQFNGGLFAADTELDTLRIPNYVFCAKSQGDAARRLFDHPKTLLFFSAKYNFGAVGDSGRKTLTLMAMGRIFEQSITDLEVMAARAAGRESLAEITKRKRDGVYYTPEWVTKYIVQRTVGARLAEIRTELGIDRIDVSDEQILANRADGRRAPVVKEYERALHIYSRRLEDLKVVDPACGSGAFLIQAFQFLYQQRQWVATELERITSTRGLFDTHAAMRSVLSNNIYGVDINAESVEITRLALWLHTALPGRPLTSLETHIRCGNSLVSEDLHEQLALSPHDISQEDLERVNPFNWESAFPEVFDRDAPGFDCVIGNPPYVIFRNYRSVQEHTVEYLLRARQGDGAPLFTSTQATAPDLFLPFIERGVRLLRTTGKLGYIAPNLWLSSVYGEGLRRFVKATKSLHAWIDFKDYQVFDEAITYTALQFFSGSPVQAVCHTACPTGDLHLADAALAANHTETSYDELDERAPWNLMAPSERNLWRKLNQHCTRLADVDGLIVGFRGVESGLDEYYHFERLGPNKYVHSKGDRNGIVVQLEDAIMRPLASTSNARRYCVPDITLWVLFPYDIADGRSRLFTETEMQASFPLTWSYLEEHSTQLRARNKGGMDRDERWWAYAWPKNLEKMVWPKLGVAQTVRRLEVFFDERGEIFFNNVRVGGIGGVPAERMWFLLGILNAPVADYVFRRIAKNKQGGYFEANRQYLEPLPIPSASRDDVGAVGRRAMDLQRLHTRRRDVAGQLERRLTSKQCEDDVRTPDWLWASVKPAEALGPEAPAHLEKRERRRWAEREHLRLLAVHLDGLDVMLRSGAELSVTVNDGEICLSVNGVTAIDGVFFSERNEARFVAAQWRHALRGVNVTDKFDGARLLRILLDLRRTKNPAIVQQVIGLDEEILGLDKEIERAEAEMNIFIYTLYGLTDEETRLVEAG